MGGRTQGRRPTATFSSRARPVGTRPWNIRVFNLALWNEIAAAKSIDKVRELRDNPANAGLISGDTYTNIFFFLEVQQVKP